MIARLCLQLEHTKSQARHFEFTNTHVGRADKPEDFIKRGCDWAEIEIELHRGNGGRPNSSNAIITRKIRLTGASVPTSSISYKCALYIVT
jgi:hypothetical protein